MKMGKSVPAEILQQIMQDSIRGSLVGQDSTCSSILQVDTGRHTGINMQRHAKTAKVVKLMSTDANDGGHQYQPMK